MIVVDILIVVFVVCALITGLKVGLFASIGWWAGLAAGAIASPWVVPVVSGLVTSPGWHGVAVVATVVVLLAIGAAIGAAIGSIFRRGADAIKLRFFERLAGGLVGAAAAALVLAAVGSTVASAGIPVVSSAVASSTTLRTIERYTPAPFAEAVARLRSVVVDDALPALGGAIAESTTVPEPQADTGTPALDEASASVARISGVAYTCGMGATGTGFVAADDLIVTNAHVVAGADSVMIELPGEPAVDGTVVHFDPIDDLAVISADVAAAPLDIVGELAPDDPAAVQGYPYGGQFTAVPATVMTVGEMLVDDVYEQGENPRDVYTLATEVLPGNSGGPLLTTDGDVTGVVFARDEGDDRVGYAMTTDELLPALDQAGTAPVSTGACRSE
ncbi:MarP family serine protease [Microbacterium halophytorum]|uniref:MarP family serine protease n=1 Tax=Microbacterium halophytorum TaxID=2067568 RepID=UPI000CFCFCAA|nr:MarP family serine protease [Microbacterium halophytorum]